MVVVVCVRQSRMVKRVKSNCEQSHSTQSQFNWFVCHSKVRRVSALSSVRKFSTIFPLWYSPPAKLESSSSHISWRVWINTLFVLRMFGDQADHRSYAEVWCDRQSLSCRCASVLCACVLCINQSIRIFLSVADWCLICTARCSDKYQCRLSAVFGFGRNVYMYNTNGRSVLHCFVYAIVRRIQFLAIDASLSSWNWIVSAYTAYTYQYTFLTLSSVLVLMARWYRVGNGPAPHDQTRIALLWCFRNIWMACRHCCTDVLIYIGE